MSLKENVIWNCKRVSLLPNLPDDRKAGCCTLWLSEWLPLKLILVMQSMARKGNMCIYIYSGHWEFINLFQRWRGGGRERETLREKRPAAHIEAENFQKASSSNVDLTLCNLYCDFSECEGILVGQTTAAKTYSLKPLNVSPSQSEPPRTSQFTRWMN